MITNILAVAVKDVTKLMKLNDFLFESHMDNVNLFKLLQYCQRSEISRKVNTNFNIIVNIIKRPVLTFWFNICVPFRNYNLTKFSILYLIIFKML